MTKRISCGFDLRVRIDLQEEDPRQADQYLVPELRNPTSADPWIWTRADQLDDLIVNEPISHPLGLRNSLDELLAACRERRIETTNMSPICLTISETSTIAFDRQFGTGYFDHALRDDELVSLGWRFLGFEPVDLSGLTSGLKGIGYMEPSWSRLRKYFEAALNKVGLFDDEVTTSRFVEVRGLQVKPHAPFVVVGILVHDSIGI